MHRRCCGGCRCSGWCTRSAACATGAAGARSAAIGFRRRVRASVAARRHSIGPEPMPQVEGGCHCGNITVRVELERAPDAYAPRACDCEFCRKHGAAWVSDPRGSLLIQIRDEADTGRYAQGDRLAEMLLCRNCGVLVGALWREQRLYGVVNASVLAQRVAFAGTKPRSE